MWLPGGVWQILLHLLAGYKAIPFPLCLSCTTPTPGTTWASQSTCTRPTMGTTRTRPAARWCSNRALHPSRSPAWWSTRMSLHRQCPSPRSQRCVSMCPLALCAEWGFQCPLSLCAFFLCYHAKYLQESEIFYMYLFGSSFLYIFRNLSCHLVYLYNL